jgi:cell division septation protein DedD
VKEMAAAGLAAAQPLSTGTTTGPQAGGGGMGGGGMGGGGMGGGMGGMGGGGMGGGMGGGRQPSPKMLLGSLVRKLDLLTGDIQIRLTDSQATAVRQKLEELAAKSAMSDDEAKEAHDALLALLDDDQKARQDAVGLPMRRGGGGGPMGGGGGGGPMGGGGAPAADASPFAREDNSKALQSLVMRLGGTPAAAPTAEEKPAEEKPAEEKPAEAKPAAEKPAEAKPAEAKP